MQNDEAECEKKEKVVRNTFFNGDMYRFTRHVIFKYLLKIAQLIEQPFL